MPVASVTPETVHTLTNFEPPTWLKHEPTYLLPYEAFDGRYAGRTDAKYLGFGLGQWRDKSDPCPLAIKSWRNTGTKWSRQSEEIPLPRHVDMTILLAHVAAGASGVLSLPAGTFANQTQAIDLNPINPLPQCGQVDMDLCRDRLRVLRQILNSLNI